MSDAAGTNGKANGHNGNGAPPPLTLPFADFSHALIRAHHDAFAMANANRALADSVRAVLRRQQDLAFELAETALGLTHDGAVTATPAAIFDRAAQAVREVGEAMIDALIEALRLLQNEAEPGSSAARPAFAFPAMGAEGVSKSAGEAAKTAGA